METYWGTPAEEIGSTDFCRFVWQHRGDFWRFLKWVERME
jgi:hypothetical protein